MAVLLRAVFDTEEHAGAPRVMSNASNTGGDGFSQPGIDPGATPDAVSARACFKQLDEGRQMSDGIFTNK